MQAIVVLPGMIFAGWGLLIIAVLAWQMARRPTLSPLGALVSRLPFDRGQIIDHTVK